jgi:hypothetical protein
MVPIGTKQNKFRIIVTFEVRCCRRWRCYCCPTAIKEVLCIDDSICHRKRIFLRSVNPVWYDIVPGLENIDDIVKLN